ncbi:MAG: efflux RND transporter periplasmic adaptor subunit [Verrucomicrobiae bacterium]|nr:efflux RND transporter periplasmic adaptor subunit [Verrucomicrobiae bacterium]
MFQLSSKRPRPDWLRAVLLGGMLSVPAAAWSQPAGPVWIDGVTEPHRDITMAFPVFGVITERHFEEGDAVRAGEVLVELDKGLEQLEVNRRQHVADLARLELDRVKALAEKQTISVSQAEVDQREAEYLIAQAEVDLAKEALRRCIMTSPIDGQVVEFFKEVGEAFEERDEVVRVVDTRRCHLVANLDESLARSLKVGQSVELEVAGGSGHLAFEGRLDYVSPVVDPASGLLRVKVLFENPDLRVRPGVLGRLRLP